MTVSNQDFKDRYTATGRGLTYATTFKFLSNEQLRVTIADTNGVQVDPSPLRISEHYNVQGAGLTRGSVTFVAGAFSWIENGALKVGYGITIERVTPLTQEADFKNQGDFFPERHEEAFDKATMIDQEQQEEIQNLKDRVGSSETNVNIAERDVENLEGRASALEAETEIANLNTDPPTPTRIGRAENRIQANEGRLTGLEGNTLKVPASQVPQSGAPNLPVFAPGNDERVLRAVRGGDGRITYSYIGIREIISDPSLIGPGPLRLFCIVKHNDSFATRPERSEQRWPNNLLLTLPDLTFASTDNSGTPVVGAAQVDLSSMFVGGNVPANLSIADLSTVKNNAFFGWVNEEEFLINTAFNAFKINTHLFDIYFIEHAYRSADRKGVAGNLYTYMDFDTVPTKTGFERIAIEATGVPAAIVMRAWVAESSIDDINTNLPNYGLRFTPQGLIASSVQGIVDPRLAAQGGFTREIPEIPEADSSKNRLVEFTLGVPDGAAFSPSVNYEFRALETAVRRIDRLSPDEIRQQYGPSNNFEHYAPFEISSANRALLRGAYQTSGVTPQKHFATLIDDYNIGRVIEGITIVDDFKGFLRMSSWGTTRRSNLQDAPVPEPDAYMSVRLVEVFRNQSGTVQHVEYDTLRVALSDVANVNLARYLGVRLGSHSLNLPLRKTSAFWRADRQTPVPPGSPEIDAFFANDVYYQLDVEFFISHDWDSTSIFDTNIDDVVIDGETPEGLTEHGTVHIYQSNPSTQIAPASAFNSPFQVRVFIGVPKGQVPPGPTQVAQLDSTAGSDIAARKLKYNTNAKRVVQGSFNYTIGVTQYTAYLGAYPYDIGSVPNVDWYSMTGNVTYDASPPSSRIPIIIPPQQQVLRYQEKGDKGNKTIYTYVKAAAGTTPVATTIRDGVVAANLNGNVLGDIPAYNSQTERLWEYSGDFNPIVTTGQSVTFARARAVSGIDGTTPPPAVIPGDVARYPSSNTVIAEGYTVQANASNRLEQGPKIGDADEAEGGTLVMRKADGGIEGAIRDQGYYIPLIDTPINIPVQNSGILNTEIELNQSFYNSENSEYVMFFEEIVFVLSGVQSGIGVGSNNVSIYFAVLAWDGAPTSHKSFLALVKNNVGNVFNEQVGFVRIRPPDVLADTTKMRFNVSYTRGNVDSLAIRSIFGRRKGIGTPLAPFSFTPQWPLTGLPINTDDFLNDLWNAVDYFSIADLVGRMFAGVPTDPANQTGYPGGGVTIRVSNSSLVTAENDTIFIFFKYVENVYADTTPFSEDNNQYFVLTSPDGVLIISGRDGNYIYGLGTSGSYGFALAFGYRTGINISINRKGRIEARAMLKGGNLSQSGNYVNDADYNNSTLLAEYALDEGAYRFCAWGDREHGSATGAIVPASGADPAHYVIADGPHLSDTLHGNHEVDFPFPSGKVIYGVEVHDRIPSTVVFPTQRAADGHKGMFIVLPWVDIQYLESISYSVQGLPTVTLWDATKGAGQFFRLLRESARSANNYVEMAVFESNSDLSPSFLGAHVHLNIRSAPRT